MAPFFLDVWMEAATQNQETVAVRTEKKTLFFIPANDDVLVSSPKMPGQSASEA